jgi:ribosomal protein S18 acetylase RimI-like enzyme
VDFREIQISNRKNIMIIKSEKEAYTGEMYAFYTDDFELAGEFSIVENCQIWDVEILEAFRGNHLCQKMLLEFISEFKGEYLKLWVEKSNIPARKSYENLGFQYIENKTFPEISEWLEMICYIKI